MKKIVTLLITVVILTVHMAAFAIHESTPAVNEKYAESIASAIENSKHDESKMDKENIYIIEKKIFDGKTDDYHYYVAIPLIGGKDTSYTSFYNGERKTEGLNMLSMIDMVETHINSKTDEYISTNSLEDVTEVVSTIFYLNGSNTRINSYRIVSSGDTYYVPYHINGPFNPAEDEACALIMGRAYSEEDFEAILRAERESYTAYREAQKKAEEERKAAEEEKEAAKYRPTMTLDENGDEVAKVNGVSLGYLLDELDEHISNMAERSSIDIDVNSDEVYQVQYSWKNGGDTDSVAEFAEHLFEELNTQITTGKPSDAEKKSSVRFNINHKKGYTKVRDIIEITVWEDGVEIVLNREEPLIFKVKDSDAIITRLKKYSDDSFDGFEYIRYDENAPKAKGNLEGLTKTDIVEFEFDMPEDEKGELNKEVSAPGDRVKGKFESYKENKYKTTYILTLSGKLGTVSFYTKNQSSLSGEEEIFSNNIPVNFSNAFRYENGNLVQYTAGKGRASYRLKMVFKSGDISEVRFNDTKCFDEKYTALSNDTKLTEKFAEKNKKEILKAAKFREAGECADTLYDFGLFKGTDKGYELDKTLTREESVTILVRLLGEEKNIKADAFDEIFTDVDKDRWSYGYIMFCYKNDITKGTGKTTFSPEAEIDAEQFITLLLRLLGYSDTDPENALEKSVEYNLLPEETIEQLHKDGAFTRSEMVQIVYNSLKTQMEDETVFADYLAEKGILTEEETEMID